MSPLRQELLDSIEARYQGRALPCVAEVIPPPGGSGEEVSPFTLVMLEGGAVGPCWNLLELPEHQASYRALDARTYQGRPALEVARELLSDDRARRIVGYAACNALSQALFLAGEPAVDTRTDLLDLAGVDASDDVGLVGYTPPLLGELADRAGQVVVLEREGDMPARDGVKVARSPNDLAGCDVVLLTSTTVLDDSLLELERVTRRARFRAIYGPGAALVPDVLFRRGLDAIAGMLITDGPTLAERHRHGQLWGDTKRKFVLSRPAYSRRAP
jgi:uncharacterized protein